MLAALLAVALPLSSFLVEVPPEPAGHLLVAGSLYDAIAADVDGDGSRDVVALERGPGTSILARAWRERPDGGWAEIGEPLEVVPRGTAGEQGNVTWPGTPIRLVARAIGSGERVTLLRQPRFEEPNLVLPCCLLLHDLAVADGRLRLVEVAAPADSVGAMNVIDLDGDGTDELVGTRSVPPLGDTSYPTDLFVHRWNGARFEVTLAQLPIGSGDTAFVLGDTDGRPGEELGIAATLGRPELHRISQRDGGRIVVEDAGIAPSWAVGLPAESGGGVVVAARDGTLWSGSWPSGGPFVPVARLDDADASLVGIAGPADEPALVVRLIGQRDPVVLALPGLDRSAPLVGTPAAERLRGGPAPPFAGLVPRGDAAGRPLVHVGGRRLAAGGSGEGVALGGARPIGLVGAGLDTMAILHAPVPSGLIAQFAGRLDPPILADTAITLVPARALSDPELDGGHLDPPVRGATSGSEPGDLLVGRRGFVAEIAAPPGSRVVVSGTDPSVPITTLGVGAAGRLDVPLTPPPAAVDGNARYRATLVVTTPAGGSYLAAWNVAVLVAPPELEATATTQLGSGDVRVRGVTAPYADVSVGGTTVTPGDDGRFETTVPTPPWPTDIEVVATDPEGNAASVRLTGIGWVDWRGLPWIPIVAALVGLAAVVLFLRVPRSDPVPATEDESVLEDVEPD